MSTILPPIPDELLHPGKLDAVVGFLRGWDLPSRIARNWLERWAAVVGRTLTADDYARVQHFRVAPRD